VVGFLVEPQNQGGEGFSGLGLKTDSYGFGDLGLKITTTVSWFGTQNQAGFCLSVAPQNRLREVDPGHALKSSSLLDVKVSLARVFQSGLKTDGGATTQRLRRKQAEAGRVDMTGCVGPCYPCFTVFLLLGPRA
jgi:hypothetical protein